MRLDERLQRQQNNQNRKNQSLSDDEEEWFQYKERKKTVDLNRNHGLLSGYDETSINVRPSVFDRTAVFHTFVKKHD